MSDTQKIVDTLTATRDKAQEVLRELNDLPFLEHDALRAAVDMQNAVFRMLERRVEAHSKSLEAQS